MLNPNMAVMFGKKGENFDLFSAVNIGMERVNIPCLGSHFGDCEMEIF